MTDTAPRPAWYRLAAFAFVAGVTVWAFLPKRRESFQSADMGTLTKTKKSPRTSKKRVADPRPKHATRTPPKAKSTAADLLKIENFGKGVNGAIVAEIVADRSR